MSQQIEKQRQLTQQDQLPPDQHSNPHRDPLSFPETLLSIFGWIFRNPLLVFCSIVLILSMCFWIVIAPVIGTSAGLAIGSWKGATSIPEGIQSGTEAGLSAKDTTARIENEMTVSGNLQVLLVDLQLTDLYQQGNDYAALLSIRGEGVFSVDLTQSRVVYSEAQNQITITIPSPTFKHDLYDSSLETIAEYKRSVFNGSTANGYHGYLNSRAQIDSQIQDKLPGYSEMVKQANTSALTQVELLAKSVCGSTASVTVQFDKGEG